MTPIWLAALRRYFLTIALANLAWEFAHMPLYTIWRDGSAGEIVFAAVHCTGGDILIATAALLGSLILFGDEHWPNRRFSVVTTSTIISGLAYTIFSEWLNTEIRGSWAYSDLMPVIPWIDAGISPLAQWIVIPALAFYWIRHLPRPS